MATEIIQVRDVPSADLSVLRTRAAESGLSLSAFLRELIHREAMQPTVGDIVRRISTRDPVEADSGTIRALIDEGRN